MGLGNENSDFQSCFSIELHLLIPRAIIEPIKREKHIEKHRRKLGRKCSVFHGPTVMSISTRCLTIFAYFYDIKRALFYFILQQRAFRNRLLTGPIQQPLKPRLYYKHFISERVGLEYWMQDFILMDYFVNNYSVVQIVE